MCVAARITLAVLFAFWPAAARAQDHQNDEAGWGDLPTEANAPSKPGEQESAPPAQAREPFMDLSSFGFLSEDVGVAPEQRARPFVLGRSTLELAGEARSRNLTLHLGLHAEADAAYLVDSDEIDAPTREVYAYRLLPWEVFVALRGGEVSLTMGRQIVAWGNSQLLRVLDLPNPRDLRMPGLGATGGERIPLTMTRLSLDHGDHRLELMAIHEVDYSFQPPPFGVYSPLPQILRSGAGVRASGLLEIASTHELAYYHEGKRFSLTSQQLLARYRYVGSSVEVGLHAGYLTHLEGALRWPVLQDPIPKRVNLPVAHPNYTVLGASLLGTHADFVGFADLLAELRRPVNVGNLDALPPEIEVVRQNWARYVVSLRYAGIDNGFIAIEHGLGHELRATDGRSQLEPLLPVAPPVVAGIYQQSFLHNQVEAELTASVFGSSLRGGRVARARVTYHPLDGVRLTLAYVFFSPGEVASPIAGFTRHDRIDVGLRWDFAVASADPAPLTASAR